MIPSNGFHSFLVFVVDAACLVFGGTWRLKLGHFCPFTLLSSWFILIMGPDREAGSLQVNIKLIYAVTKQNKKKSPMKDRNDKEVNRGSYIFLKTGSKYSSSVGSSTSETRWLNFHGFICFFLCSW